MSYNIIIVVPQLSVDDAVTWQELELLLENEGTTPPAVFRTLHDQLTARYPCLNSLSDDEIDDGVWSDGPLINNFGEQTATLGICYSRVEEVMPFLVETATALGLTVFDGQTGHIHRADGLRGTALTVEGSYVLQAPTLRQVLGAVDRLTPNGGPGFLVFERAGHNYTQAAGGDGVYTAEWREAAGDSFRHYVAGHAGQSDTKDIAIPTNGFQVTVKENEQLTAAEVKAILEVFAAELSRPAAFSWRDVTERFS